MHGSTVLPFAIITNRQFNASFAIFVQLDKGFETAANSLAKGVATDPTKLLALGAELAKASSTIVGWWRWV